MKIAELLQSQIEDKVQYVPAGGLAVQLHGFLRSTFDIDLVQAMIARNIDRFIAVAKRHGLVPTMPVSIDSLRNPSQIEPWHREMGQAGKPRSCCSQKGMRAFALREPHIGGSVVDILVRPDVTFDNLMTNAVAGELFAMQVWIASFDDLLTMKRIANRPKDQLDIVALEKIKRGEDPNV